MIIRRLVVSLVLVLFASVTIGVIVGLDDAARSDLVNRLPGAAATVAAPATPTTSAVQTTPRPTPTLSTPTPSTSTPPARPSPKSTPTAKAQASTTPTTATRAKPPAKPTVKPSPKPTRQPSTGTKAGSSKMSKKAKKQAARYLTGPLKKGAGGTVYLTFDDGPSRHTATILDVLSRTGSTATFFHLGVNEGGFPHADARIRAQGSKVANHSYNHPDLTRLTAAQLKWQLRNGPRAKCFRPPYGATDTAVRNAISKAGMRQVLWSIDTLDWTKPGIPTLAKTGRLKSVRDGSIVLMHDGGGDRTQTVAALPRVIADLHARGFKVRALPYC